jgi:hypothetical protein
MPEHPRRWDEKHVVAAATGFVAERLGQMRLADAGRALNQHALVALEELAGG